MILKISSWKKDGFTLAELLVTVTILIILGLAVLIGLNPMVQLFKGYDARRKADLYKLRTAFEAYYQDHDCYPPSSILQQCGSDVLQPYLTAIPCDPQTGEQYQLELVPDDICPQRYAIYSTLMSPTDPEAKYPECPQVMAVTSPNMTYIDIVNACALIDIPCSIFYGCNDQGFCAVMGVDEKPICSNDEATTYCDADCGTTDCSTIVRGSYIYACNPLP